MPSPSPVTISVAMCTCMGQQHLEAQLQSIAHQTRLPEELVINDDASTDDTVTLINAFAKTAPFPVRLERNPQRLGVTGNFARAISRCEKSVIVLSDQDDVWGPDKLAHIAAAFERDVDLDAVFTDLALTSPTLQPTGQTQWNALGFDEAEQTAFAEGRGFHVLLRRNVVTGAAMAFRADTRQWFEPIPDEFVHDEWIALIIAACGNIQPLREITGFYRAHASQQIGAGPQGILGQLAYARAKMGPEYFAKQVQRGQELLVRLSKLDTQVRDPMAAPMAANKLMHINKRVLLRRYWMARVPGALFEYLNGNYHRFAYGWKSFAQDLFL